MKSKVLPVIICLLVLFGNASCEKKEEKVSGEGKLKVVTSLFPLYDFARNVGGQKTEVTLLLPPGVEPHSFEPRPGDVFRLNKADVFIYTGTFMEPWVDDMVKGLQNEHLLVIDASAGITLREIGGTVERRDSRGHEAGRIDPHIWLDLSKAQKMVETIVGGFVEKDPANRDLYLKNGETYEAKLAELDRAFSAGLSGCKKDIILHGGHFAFNYLAQRYHLKYRSAYKGSPDAEPSPGDVLNISKAIQQYGLKHVFYEELITPKVAETIARETGASLLKLHGAHNITKEEMESGITFISLMEQNLKNLRIGLQCP